MNNFDVLKIMSERNMKIKSFPLSNMTYITTGKEVGRITLMIDNETAADIMAGKPVVFALIVADADEFKRIDREGSDTQDDEICPECDGSGEVAGDYFADDGMTTCSRCGGRGKK